MTNAIVKHQSMITSLDELQRVARMYAVSSFFDAKGNTDQAIAQMATKIMAGQELGYGPFASVQGIHVIQGRPALSANLMAATVKSHPHYNYKVREMSDENVSIEFFEDGESIGTSAFSAKDAKKADTKNMGKFPRNMLFARAMSNGVRWFCPDVFAGNAIYTPDELGATVNDDGDMIDAPATNGNGYHVVNDTPPVKPDASDTISDTGPTILKPITLPLVPPEKQSTHMYDPENDTARPIVYEEEEDTQIPDPVAEWLSAENAIVAAHEWAVACGAQENAHSSQNSLSKIVKKDFNGKHNPGNMAEVLSAFYFRQHEHLAELADASTVDAEPIAA